MSSVLGPRELQHTRPPCPSLSPRVCSNSCPLSRWCHPTILSLLPLLLLSSVFPRSRVFSNESAACIRLPKYWSFRFSISPSNEYTEWISFRIHWFDHIAVQGTLKSLLQHHSLKASILWCSAFSMVHLSHPYMTTGKTTALTIWTFVDKVMYFIFIFNMLSRFIIAFLPRSKSFNFMAAVTVHSDFWAQQNKICHYIHFSLIYLPYWALSQLFLLFSFNFI